MASPTNCRVRTGCLANILFAAFSGCFLAEVFTQNSILLRSSMTMSRVVELLYSRRVPQVAVLALMSIGFGSCSADMSTRLSQNSVSNPFASQLEATGAVRRPRSNRHELPQYCASAIRGLSITSSALPPPISRRILIRHRRWVRRRARPGLLFSARPSDSCHRRCCAALGGRHAGPVGRHHDHRRHQ